MAETLPSFRDTAHGRVYRPLPELAQGGVLILVFTLSMGMGCMAFGHALAWLARRGYLPMMESE